MIPIDKVVYTGKTGATVAAGTEVIDQDRRRLLNVAATGIAATGAASLFRAYRASAATSDAIRPFRINVPEKDLVDLRKRLAGA